VRFSLLTLEKLESRLSKSMAYFGDWKEEHEKFIPRGGRKKYDECFLSAITYNDLHICVSGFLAYVKLIPNGEDWNVEYGPALHSNTISLEAWFSLVRSMNKDRADGYLTAVSTFGTGQSSVALRGDRCKSYTIDDPTPEGEGDVVSAFEKAMRRKDKPRIASTEKFALERHGSGPLLIRRAYRRRLGLRFFPQMTMKHFKP
jgi:hypothetical protein